MQPMINIALRAVRSAGEQSNHLLEREDLSFSNPEQIAQIVSRVESILYDSMSRAIQRAYPSHKIAVPGDLKGSDQDYSWHIMPIHNPAAMIKGLSDWALSVICKKNNHPEHIIVMSPTSDDEFTASRGRGATMNDRRIRCADTKELSLSVMITDILENVSSSDNATEIFDLYKDLDKNTFSIRNSQCAALDIISVAAGKADVAVLKDLAQQESVAALLIAQEAGVLYADILGNPIQENSRTLICCNPKLFKQVVQKFHPKKTLFS